MAVTVQKRSPARWASHHGIDVDDARGARMYLRFNGTVEEAGRAIREGFRVWTDAGMPEERFRQVQIRFVNGSFGDAWQWWNHRRCAYLHRRH